MAEDMTPTKAVAPWTEEAKTQFLLRIIAQLKEDGRTINWSRLQMEGRTTKSLQNMWTKITKEIADLGEGSVGTPSKAKATPRKSPTKKPKKAEAWEAANGGPDPEDDALSQKSISTPKKRAAGQSGPKTPRKKAKVSDSENEKSHMAENDGMVEF